MSAYDFLVRQIVRNLRRRVDDAEKEEEIRALFKQPQAGDPDVEPPRGEIDAKGKQLRRKHPGMPDLWSPDLGGEA